MTRNFGLKRIRESAPESQWAISNNLIALRMLYC